MDLVGVIFLKMKESTRAGCSLIHKVLLSRIYLYMDRSVLSRISTQSLRGAGILALWCCSTLRLLDSIQTFLLTALVQLFLLAALSYAAAASILKFLSITIIFCIAAFYMRKFIIMTFDQLLLARFIFQCSIGYWLLLARFIFQCIIGYCDRDLFFSALLAIVIAIYFAVHYWLLLSRFIFRCIITLSESEHHCFSRNFLTLCFLLENSHYISTERLSTTFVHNIKQLYVVGNYFYCPQHQTTLNCRHLITVFLRVCKI